MALGEKVGNAYIEVHADTKSFRAAMKALEKSAKSASSSLDKDLGKSVADLRDELDKTDKSIDKSSDSVKGLAKEAKNASPALKNLGKDSKGTRSTLDALNDTIRDAKKYTADMNDEISSSGAWRNFRRQMQESERDGRTLSDRFDDLTSKVKNLGTSTSRTARGMRGANQLFVSMRGGVDRLSTSMDNAVKKSGNSFSNLFTNMGRRISRSWMRMDSTVRLVLTLILTAGGPVAAALSGMSAGLTAIASSAYLAVAALGPLVGLLAPFAYGVGLAVAGLKDLEKFSPAAAAGLDELKRVFKSVDLPAFMAEWSSSLEGFFTTLAKALETDQLAAALGGSFATITDAFTSVFGGDVFANFTNAMEGPLATALANFGASAANIFEGLLAFFDATAPVVQTISDLFLAWAQNWNDAMQAGESSGTLETFFSNAVTSLQSILGFLGEVGDFLNVVFAAGAESGNTFLDMLSGIFNGWTEMLSAADSTSLADWFATGLEIMTALGPLLSGLGQMLNNLVTPSSVAMVVSLFDVLGQFLPILGEILNVISELGILNLIAEAFLVIGQALKPILPALKTLATSIFGALGSVIQSLAPVLGTVAELIGGIAEAMAPIITKLGDAFVSIFGTLAPILTTVVEAFEPLLPILTDILTSAIEALLPFIEQLITKLGPVLTSVIQALMPIIQALVPIIDALLPVFVALIPLLFPVINLIAQLAPVVTPLIGLVADLVTWLLELITPLIELIAPLLELIAQFLVMDKGISKLGAVFTKVFSGIINWFKKVWDYAGGFVTAISKFFTNLGSKVSSTVTNWLSKMWSNLKNFFVGSVQMVLNFVEKVIRFFVNLQAKIIKTVTNLASKVINLFKELPGKVIVFVAGLVGSVLGFFQKIPDTVRGFISDIVSFFKGLPNKIMNALSGLGGRIKDLFSGFAENLNPLNWFASGGIVTGPTRAIVGEAGPEAIVPLNRDLSRVDPSVRGLSAMLQGRGGGGLNAFASGGVAGGGITVAEGAIQVMAPEANPSLVAESVLDRLVAYAR